MGADIEIAAIDDLAEISATATGSLFILDESGDSRIQWNKDDPEQVAKAEAEFNRFKAKGYLAYNADTNEVMQHFDAAAERVIIHQRMIGG